MNNYYYIEKHPSNNNVNDDEKCRSENYVEYQSRERVREKERASERWWRKIIIIIITVAVEWKKKLINVKLC